ncbi:molybdopterin-dependent oxidoreductase [Rhodopila sp.]|uniref:molybdopterin-dependent oxidoreductase n=1 Tax=Rhodopila sp. TaxID=2480087 RepID=UPI003D11606A
MLNPLHVDPDLIIRSRDPFNAEPGLVRLRAAFRTAQADFYVRSHGDIPALDAASYRLRVAGRVTTPMVLSLDALRERFPIRTVSAVMQCAGNRRADLNAVRPVTGDPWAPGAIGNADWTGVALADVLRAAGVAEQDPSLHVAFSAGDEIEMDGEGRFTYGVSIPIGKALSPEVLLAFEMNGEPLMPQHGFPLRAVVPGFAGVRSAKWLTDVIVQDRPSDNHMQRRDYKMLPADMTRETVDWERGIMIYDMPLNAAICEPAPFADLEAGFVTLRGYAIATARKIVRVEVSVNGGGTWMQAALEPRADAPWSWTFWEVGCTLPKGEHELVVRAWDSAGQAQPARPEDIWNFKGYLSAAWHRVPIRAH